MNIRRFEAQFETVLKLSSSLNWHNVWMCLLNRGSVCSENTTKWNNHCILIKEESMYAFKVENVSHDNILTTKDCNWLVTFSNTEKRVENTTHSRVFLTNLEVSHCRNSFIFQDNSRHQISLLSFWCSQSQDKSSPLKMYSHGTSRPKHLLC